MVLYYHDVSVTQREGFARQMDELIRWTDPIAADYCVPLSEGRRYSVVTFDDGFVSTIENAIPELLSRGIPVTLFIPSGLLGEIPKWMTFDDDFIADEQIASETALKDLPHDLVAIGSHSISHPWLPHSTEQEARLELTGSRDKLRILLKREIKLFSFPYGAFNERLLEWCRDAGYDRVFTTLPNLALGDPHEFVTGRIKVEPDDWPLEFRLKLLGAYRWLPLAFVWKRKILSGVVARASSTTAEA